MSLADRLGAALKGEPSDDSSKDNSENDEAADVRRDFFRGLTAEEIESLFLECSHQKRIEYVDQGSRKIPKQHWWKFNAYLEYNDDATHRWGLNDTHTKETEAAILCEYDEAQVEVVTVEYMIGESTTESNSESEGISYGVNRFLNIGTQTQTTKGETESESSEKTVTKIITECQTNRGDCKLNRKAFIRYGREVVSRGSGYRTYLDMELDRITDAAGIDVNKPGSQTSTDTG